MAKLILILLLIVLVGVVVFLVRKRDQSLLTKIGIVGVGAAIGIPLLVALYYHSTYATLSGFISNVAEAFGWPSEIAAAISVLMIVPATIAFGMAFSLDQVRRRTGVFLLTLGISAYWVLIWAGTNDHMVTAEGGELKCYTIDVDGVRYFDQQQIDPRTGEMCQWVNLENLRYVQRIDEKLQSGEPIRRIPQADFDDLRLFATGTSGAIPLVWYFRDQDGTIELFDAPGVHPVFGEMLEPITPEIARVWRAALVTTQATETQNQVAELTPTEPSAEPIVEQTSPPAENEPRLLGVYNYSDVAIDFGTIVDGRPETRLRANLLSIGHGEAAPNGVQGEYLEIEVDICNIGNQRTNYAIGAYFTSANGRSFSWPTARLHFMPGQCQTFTQAVMAERPLSDFDLTNGELHVHAGDWFNHRLIVSPANVQYAAAD